MYKPQGYTVEQFEIDVQERIKKFFNKKDKKFIIDHFITFKDELKQNCIDDYLYEESQGYRCIKKIKFLGVSYYCDDEYIKQVKETEKEIEKIDKLIERFSKLL